MVSHCFDFISLVITDVEHFLLCLLIICMSFLEISLFRTFAPFMMRCFFLLSCLFMYFGYYPFVGHIICK